MDINERGKPEKCSCHRPKGHRRARYGAYSLLLETVAVAAAMGGRWQKR